MLYFSKLKIFTIFAICLCAILILVPNFLKDPEKLLGSFGSQTIKLGLDLRGGSYLLMEVDFDAYFNEQLENLKDELRLSFKNKIVDGSRIKYSGGLQTVNNKIALTLDNEQMLDEVTKLVKAISNDLEISSKDNNVTIGYSDKYIKNMRTQLLAQSLEIIRRRVDATGTREPDIQREGDNRILLQVPGLEDPKYLKEMLGRTAKMTFHLLDSTMPYPDNSKLPVPSGSIRVKSDTGDSSFTLIKRVAIGGDLVSSATAGFNQMNGQAVVNLSFNSLGAKKFAEITKNNMGKPFAIVLDNKVLTAPVIRSAILNGHAEISGSFTTQSAADLALLLRAGALPAPVKIVEERTVGPSLGSDSILDGTKAGLLGMVLVVSFMVFFYRLFGIFASGAMIFHIAMTVAVLSLLGATLTLPGIAGIVLGMGMAVDANVLIFERMREELHLGRSLLAAIENGYKKAFTTIFDSNITTLIASIVMFYFGSGPIKGFAVTLCIGILTSIFTSVLLTRLITVWWLRKFKPTTLPI